MLEDPRINLQLIYMVIAQIVKSLKMLGFNSNNFGYYKKFIKLLIINNQTQWL